MDGDAVTPAITLEALLGMAFVRELNAEATGDDPRPAIMLDTLPGTERTLVLDRTLVNELGICADGKPVTPAIMLETLETPPDSTLEMGLSTGAAAVLVTPATMLETL